MKLLIAVSAVALGASMVAATCPNLCSGHGTCGESDRCTCFGNWQGADCSERVCPYGLAWVDAPSATDTAHWYAECSNKGVCDRTTGLCQCYEGYDGKGCRRSTCPNDCSGHGTCYFIEDISSRQYSTSFVVDYSRWEGSDNALSYTTWDVSKIQACVCDPYYEGTDCSLRECPRGDNTLTLNDVATVQFVSIADGGAAVALGGAFTLTFTDLYGGTWETRPIVSADFAAETKADLATAITNALEALPNQVVEDVNCTPRVDGTPDYVDMADSTIDGIAFMCTFTGEQLAGKQHLLQVNTEGCNRRGCNPKYAGISFNLEGGEAYELVSVTVTDETCTGNAVTECHMEAAVCSEHGLCDSETGLCDCFSGYYDEDCSKQTILI